MTRYLARIYATHEMWMECQPSWFIYADDAKKVVDMTRAKVEGLWDDDRDSGLAETRVCYCAYDAETYGCIRCVVTSGMVTKTSGDWTFVQDKDDGEIVKGLIAR